MPYGSSARDHHSVVRDPDAKADFEPTSAWKSKNTPQQQSKQPSKSAQLDAKKDQKASKQKESKEVSWIAVALIGG